MISKRYIKVLREFRKFHRYLGLSLAILLVISALTGILLALKKDVDIIQPPTQKGQSKQLTEWQSLDQLAAKATAALAQAQPEQADNPINRLDVRPSKGIVKVLFKNQHWEVQIDGKSGEVLSIARRHSDWIEALHDGSIISDLFKLISMNFLGIGLLVLIVSGFWLWYGPKRFRSLKRRFSKRKNPVS
ncbi:MAG: PepSY-associated TM helix domain-containing protein [Bacteroidota bacterium]